MIIMINGAFGVGKTSVAKKLLKQITNSMLYDPEEVGYMLRNIITDDIKTFEERTDNFQDLDIWKSLVVQVAHALILKYKKNLIVPMTIYNRDYFHYIHNGFKEIDHRTYHFCLVATEETIYSRLIRRGEIVGNWCFQQTKKCIEAFDDNCFEQHIFTDHESVDGIVEIIINRIKQSPS